MRADARRNEERLITAASEAFAQHGPHVCLEDIARDAGVGIGTLYRHFPTRQALLEGVYRDQVDALSREAQELLMAPDPAVALSTWLHALLTNNLTRRGLKETLMAGEISELVTECKMQMHRSGARLLARAQEANAVRRDLDISDLLRLVHGISMMVEPGAEGMERAERLFSVMMAGLQV
jgi:AcrR family transcriptional regulator